MRNQNSQKTVTPTSPRPQARNPKKELFEAYAIFACEYVSSILQDAYNRLHLLYGFADYTRDLAYFSRRIKHEGFSFVANDMPNLMAGLLQLLEHGTSSFPGFKTRNEQPVFLRRLFKAATDERHSAEVQATAMRFIYNISCGFKKLRGDLDESTLQQQYEEFVETDVALACVNFHSEELRDIMESIATQWLSFADDIDPFGCETIPRPGPGACVDNTPKNMRYSPHVRFKTVDAVFPYVEWFYATLDAVNYETRNYLAMPVVEEPHSEYLIVPKTFKKGRGICKEANEVQFLQQGLRRVLYNAIERKLDSQVPIRKQEVHKQLALTASRDREKATIDESEASDRIARCAVEYMTKYTPEWQAALMAVSSRLIVPSKRIPGQAIRTNKFAPMGSAVCFPIMSLFHLFAIRAIILCSDYGYADKTRFCKEVSVYGDDIVLPSAIVPLIYTWLPKLGLKINESKSYAKSFFRESCGCHAYKGHDITPVYIKYIGSKSTEASECQQMASLLAVESSHHANGYDSASKFLREHIEAKWGKLPYVSNVTSLVGFVRQPMSSDLTDFSILNKSATSRRWDRSLQSFKYRLKCWSSPVEQACMPSEMQAYFRYFCLSPRNDVTYRIGGNNSPLLDFLRRVDDEATELKISVAPLFSSQLFGHTLKRDTIGCMP